MCNVEIGVGGWDNYLCDLLDGYGQLTSVDIVPDICEFFAYRQSREGHPNPSNVICSDILSNELPPESFDVVTAIGSTAVETGNYEGCLEACWRLVRPGGHMMFMDFNFTPMDRAEKWAKSAGCEIVDFESDPTVNGYAFWLRKGTTLGDHQC